jgi:hypothetical protein
MKNISSAKILLFIYIIYLAGFFAHALYLQKTVYGDGIFYFSWLRSIVIDHNVNFANEYAHFHAVQQLTKAGILGNIYPVGPAIFWFPGYYITHTVLGGDGFGFLYQLVLGLTSVSFAWLGILLLYRYLSNRYSQVASLLSVVSIAFATNLFFYGSLDTVNSHAIGFFIMMVYLTLLTNTKKNYLVIGLALGALTLIRTQDAVFAILLVTVINKQLWKTFFGIFIGFSPQLIAWQLLYHKFWSSPYLDRGYGFNFLHPQIFNTLFSPNHGLFLWTPILLLASYGVLKYKGASVFKYAMLTAISAQIFVISSWTTWWQGASFSGRMFVTAIPLFALGLGCVYERLVQRGNTWVNITKTIVIPFSFLNVCAMVFYLLYKP